MDVLKEYVETLENYNRAKSIEIEIMAKQISQLSQLSQSEQPKDVIDSWSQTDMQDEIMESLRKTYDARSIVANQHIEEVMKFRESLRLSLYELNELKKYTNKIYKISCEQFTQTAGHQFAHETTMTKILATKMKKTANKWLDYSKKLDPDDSEYTRCIESVFLSKYTPHFMSKEVSHIGLYTNEIEKVSYRLIKENMFDEAHKLKSIAKKMRGSIGYFTRYFNNMQKFWKEFSVDFENPNKSVLQGFTSMYRLAYSIESKQLNHSVDLRVLENRVQRLKEQNYRIKRQSIT